MRTGLEADSPGRLKRPTECVDEALMKAQHGCLCAAHLDHYGVSTHACGMSFARPLDIHPLE